MKKLFWVGIITISILLTGCGLSDKSIQRAIAEIQEGIGKIQTAIAETEAAKTTATSTLSQTFTPEPTKTTEPTTTQSETPIESSVSNELFDGRIGISVTNVETFQDLTAEYDLSNPDEGNAYVVIHLTVTRIEGVHLVNIIGFKEEKPLLYDGEGQSYDFVYWEFKGIRFQDPKDITSATEMVEGSEGVIVFEIPVDREPESLDLIYAYQETWDQASPQIRGEITIPFE